MLHLRKKFSLAGGAEALSAWGPRLNTFLLLGVPYPTVTNPEESSDFPSA